MAKINIAFGVTPDWLKYTYVTICSILSNSDESDEFKFYFLCEETDDNFGEVYEKLSRIKKFEYEFIKTDNTFFDGMVHDKRVGVSAYYRLRLASLTDVDKIIYLDSDIVVLDDIKELWDYDIDNYLIGAVEDKYSALMTCHANLSDDDIYINSGVMLMNLKKFRELEDKIFSKLREDGNEYSDQDVLNDICRDRILYLPLKYNLMLTTDDPNAFPERKEEYNEAIKKPFILHYSIKPWILPVQYSEYWRKYNDLLK